MPSPRGEYYIIETGCREMVALNQAGDPDYANLLKLEKERKLVSDNPRVQPRACLKQTPDMLTKDCVDEESGLGYREFKEEVLLCPPADSRGRLYLLKGQEEDVRRILRDLRRFNKNVKLDENGLMLPEEMTEDQKQQVKNKGGRGNKKA